MQSKWRVAVILPLAGCLISGFALASLSCGKAAPATPTPEAQLPAETEYLERWQATVAALIEFTFAEMEAPLPAEGEELALGELAPLYQNKRDEFAAALATLQQASPPPGFEEIHSQALPLYEEMLASMDMIIEGASQNDKESVLEGWAMLIDATEKTKAVMEQGQP